MKARITGLELAFMVAGIIQGPALLISFSSRITKHDTWLVILAAYLFTLIFLTCYVYLTSRFPNMNLIEMNKIVYGKYLGCIVSIYYIMFFMETLSYHMSDLSDFCTTFLMEDTPGIFFIAVIALVFSYAAYCGIKIIANIAHLIVFIVIFIICSTFILLLPKMDFSNFLPIFEISVKDFIHGAHIISGIPFVGLVCLLMIMGYTDNPKKLVVPSIVGFTIGAFSLLLISIRNTAVLGPTEPILISTSFEATRLIDVGKIFTRVDILIGIGQILVLSFLTFIFFFVTVTAISSLLGLKSHKPIILPIAVIEVILAAIAYRSNPEHIKFIDPYIIHIIPIMYIFPPLALLIAKIRKLPKT